MTNKPRLNQDLEMKIIEIMVKYQALCHCESKPCKAIQELLAFIQDLLDEQKEEIINELVTIRDVELKEKPMMQNRAAYNINLLIDQLKKGEDR